MRVAINGMGRIGRLLFRKLVNHPAIELVAINDIMSVDNLAYLLKYDSVYGTFPGVVSRDGDYFVVGEKRIQVLSEDHPSRLPWKALQVDAVLECSGKFTTRLLAEEHLKSGASKVLLSTTGSDEIPL